MSSVSEKDKEKEDVPCWKKKKNTFYVSKAERSRLIRNLRDRLETKAQENNICRVTQELTVILMKLTKLKAQFSDLEQKENHKHIALRRMMDLVKDDICSLLRKEKVTTEEVALVVNRTHDIETLMCKIWKKFTYDEGFISIDVGPDGADTNLRPNESGDETPKRSEEEPKIKKTEKHLVHIDPSKNQVETEEYKPVMKTIDMKKSPRESKNRETVRETSKGSKKSDDGLYIQSSKSKTKVTPEKKNLSDSGKNISSERSSYPYGYKDLNIRKDNKSFHNIGYVTTTRIAQEDSERSSIIKSKKTKSKKKMNKSIFKNGLLSNECLGRDARNCQNKVNTANSIHLSESSSSVSNKYVDLKSSCVVGKLKRQEPIIDLINVSPPDQTRSTNNLLRIYHQTRQSSMLDKQTSYDDFILDPNFSLESRKQDKISKRRYVIDTKTWRYMKSSYNSDIEVKPVLNDRQKLETKATLTYEYYRSKKDNFSQTEGIYSNQIQQVFFLKVLYTSTYFGYYVPQGKHLFCFPQETTVIEKSKDDNGLAFVTCRADPAKGIAHFTLIQNYRSGDLNSSEESVLKLNQVKDMWLKQVKEFFLHRSNKDHIPSNYSMSDHSQTDTSSTLFRNSSADMSSNSLVLSEIISRTTV